ncbi:MAG: DUF3108 domain-containing protein [candidate division NC10 bacterium]|nr:DUF3108 domain-containing protein [candidate division NC10 bacterium]
MLEARRLSGDILLFLLIGFFGSGGSASADPLKVPPMDAKERGAVVTSAKNGGVRWEAEWTMEQVTVNGQRLVRFTETGQGLYSPFREEVRWTLEAFWKTEDAFSPLSFEKTVRDLNGRLLVKERKAFDFARGKVRFERQDSAAGTSTTKELAVPSDTLAVEGIGTALRSLPFEPPRPFRTHLLTNEPDLYEVTLEPRGRERVKTQAGEFECYKVELVPNLGLLSVFRVFVPKTYFWFTVAPPHFWVRYQGLESGLGTPHVVMELATFERQE